MSLEHRKLLFGQHVVDLQKVCLCTAEVFVCPICLNTFTSEQIETGLTVGHVWPDFVRDAVSSPEAKHHQVLLCDSCNSKAGRAGDAEMQEHEKARRGIKPGMAYIHPPNHAEPIKLRSFITTPESPDDNNLSIRYSMTRGKYLHNPDIKRFREIRENQTPVDIVYVEYDTDSALAKAGWLTSAYLFAFYTFGYRYILHTKLDPIRDYIQQSFEKVTDRRLDFEPQKEASVRICRTCDNQVPLISYIFHTLGTVVPHHLEISILDYHVRLPVPLKYPIGIPEGLLPAPGMVIARDARHYTASYNPCPWSDILADPEYSIDEKSLSLTKRM